MEITKDLFVKLKSSKTFEGKVVSDSMNPIIKVGDIIQVDVGVKNLKRFDIIVFHDGSKLICHYLWNMNKIVEPLLLQTRNMRKEKDFPITWEQYLGKVTSHQISFFQKLRLLF